MSKKVRNGKKSKNGLVTVYHAAPLVMVEEILKKGITRKLRGLQPRLRAWRRIFVSTKFSAAVYHGERELARASKTDPFYRSVDGGTVGYRVDLVVFSVKVRREDIDDHKCLKPDDSTIGLMDYLVSSLESPERVERIFYLYRDFAPQEIVKKKILRGREVFYESMF